MAITPNIENQISNAVNNELNREVQPIIQQAIEDAKNGKSDPPGAGPIERIIDVAWTFGLSELARPEDKEREVYQATQQEYFNRKK